MPSNPSSLVILYTLYALFICAHCFFKQARGKKNSHTGTRTRVGEVKTRYPNRLDYMGLNIVPDLSSTKSGTTQGKATSKQESP